MAKAGLGAGLAVDVPAGLQFPATQVSSTDANMLDDYEEGSWTPSLGGTTTYTVRVGTYVKIGKFVLAHFDIQVNAIGTGSASVVSGLPFTVAATPAFFGGTVNFFSGLGVSVVFLNYAGGANTTQFTMQGMTAAGAATGGVGVFTSGTRIAGTVIYLALA